MDSYDPLTNLNGALSSITKAKNVLAPLYEAMSNSLEALAQRGVSADEKHQIGLDFYFEGLSEEMKELERLEIADNGSGFNSESFSRFREFFDRSKGYQNRGTGRLQYLHRFQSFIVDSIFKEEDKWHRRRFKCDKENFITNHNDEILEEGSQHLTKVILKDYSPSEKEKGFFDDIKPSDIVSDIKKHFLLRFYLDDKKPGFEVPKITVRFLFRNELIEEVDLSPEKITQPLEKGTIKVLYMKLKDPDAKKIEWEPVVNNSHVINWAHFKVDSDELAQNGVYLCSKDIPVSEITYPEIKKNEDIAGSKYLTAFYGQIFDDPNNVSDSVDSFKFPQRSDIENNVKNDLFFDNDSEFLFIETINEEIRKVLPRIYSDVLQLKNEKNISVESIANAHAIPPSIIHKAGIGVNDDEKTITKKLYKAQSEELAEKNFRVLKVYKGLKELNPTQEDYQIKLEEKTIELSKLVEEQDKEELSRYVIRREMVTNILRKILNEELEYQTAPRDKGERRDKEGLIHDLIFKRRKDSNNTINDLWILNEEFLHFEGCSDIPLNEIELSDGSLLMDNIPQEQLDWIGSRITKRPDIFLFALEGKCLLVELKAPDVDLSDHLNQMRKYCKIIANFSKSKITNFYCYLIGENFDPMLDLPDDFEETVNGDWIQPREKIKSFNEARQDIATVQLEVIKLSSIHLRAHRRNLSFAEKLGLPNLLESLNEQ